MNDGIECTLTKFAVGGEAAALEERTTIERDLSEVEDRAIKNYMCFRKDKCKVLYKG